RARVLVTSGTGEQSCFLGLGLFLLLLFGRFPLVLGPGRPAGRSVLLLLLILFVHALFGRRVVARLLASLLSPLVLDLGLLFQGSLLLLGCLFLHPFFTLG